MSRFHCVVSSAGDIAHMRPDQWPRCFPQLGSGWIFSDCGRFAVHLAARAAADTRQRAFHLSIGQGETADIVIDLASDRLTIERGHLGRERVHFFQTDALTLLSNCLSDILHSVESRIHYGSALHYLAYGTPLPGQTLVNGVRSLAAGHALTLCPSVLPVQRRTFELLSATEPVTPDPDQVTAIAAAVDAAILRSCEGPGRAALLLSAGVDSSYMAAVLGERVDTCYTSCFPDLDQAGEFEDASRFSRLTGRRHHPIPIRIADARQGLERVLAADEPKSAWSTIVHDLICQAAGSDGNSRLLSGLGADEVFGGYFHYARSFRDVWGEALRIDPGGTRNPLDTVLGSPRSYRGRLFTGIPSFFDSRTLRRAVAPRLRHWDPYQSSVHFYREALTRKPDLHLFEAMIAHEAQHRIPDLLIAGFEAFSRDQGLASGYPFLDVDVMRKAAALGAEMRFRHDAAEDRTWNKLLWREMAGRRLPDFVMARPPSAYDAPIHDWFADRRFLDIICDAISLQSLLDLDVLSRAWIEGFVDRLRAEDRSTGMIEQAWVLATFGAWQDRMLDKG